MGFSIHLTLTASSNHKILDLKTKSPGISFCFHFGWSSEGRVDASFGGVPRFRFLSHQIGRAREWSWLWRQRGGEGEGLSWVDRHTRNQHTQRKGILQTKRCILSLSLCLSLPLSLSSPSALSFFLTWVLSLSLFLPSLSVSPSGYVYLQPFFKASVAHSLLSHLSSLPLWSWYHSSWNYSDTSSPMMPTNIRYTEEAKVEEGKREKEGEAKEERGRGRRKGEEREKKGITFFLMSFVFFLSLSLSFSFDG